MKKAAIVITRNFLLLIFCFSFTAIAQIDLAKYAPWPPIFKHSVNKIPPNLILPPKPAARGMFTGTLNVDTTTFTPVTTSLPGVTAGNATWFDYDNDGKLDVMVSGYVDSGYYITRIYTRSGDDFTEIPTDIKPLETERAVAWGDYDNDGDLDLAITGRTDTTQGSIPAARIYRNDNGTFVDIDAPLMQIYGSNANWVDIDGDGDLDLQYCGSPDEGVTFYTLIYRNDRGTFTPLQTSLPGVWGASCAWGDYDNDGDLDLLLTGYGVWGVTAAVFRNDGPAGDTGWVFTNINAPITPVNSGAVMWADYDNDGYLDIILTGTASGNNETANIYHNEKGQSFVDIGANLQGASVSALAVGDYDNDGDLDLAISGSDDWTYGTNPTVRIYRNDNGTFVDIGARITGTWYGSLEWGDYDNDGKLDLIVTGATVGRPYIQYFGPYYPITQIYRNNLPTVNTPPEPPPNISAMVVGHNVRFSWGKATDNQTVQNSLTYNIRVGTSPNTSTLIDPAANLSTGYRRAPLRGNTEYRTARMLRNLPEGTYYWSVQAVDNGYAGSQFAGVGTFVIAPPAAWYLISVPYTHQDMSKAALFPTSISNAYTYNGARYAPATILQNGTAYWLKFLKSGLPTILQGGPLSSLAIPLSEGWNMIGSVDHSVDFPVGGIVIAGPYSFEDSYTLQSVLEPGKGYWVKAASAGELTLGAAIALPSNPVGDLRVFNGITIRDSEGKTQKLFFGKRPKPDFSADRYELPPPGPEEMFDARFSSGRMLEAYPEYSAEPSEYSINIRGASLPLTISCELVPGTGEKVFLNGTELKASESVSVTKSGSLSLKIEHSRPSPEGYVVNQNYPNPFNPTTLISFGLPVEAHVTLKIFNVLGQEVATLADEKKPAGWHEVRWDASSFPSGIYFSRFVAGEFQSTQKIILMR